MSLVAKVGVIGRHVLGKKMDDDMANHPLPECVIELLVGVQESQSAQPMLSSGSVPSALTSQTLRWLIGTRLRNAG